MPGSADAAGRPQCHHPPPSPHPAQSCDADVPCTALFPVTQPMRLAECSEDYAKYVRACVREGMCAHARVLGGESC